MRRDNRTCCLKMFARYSYIALIKKERKERKKKNACGWWLEANGESGGTATLIDY